MIKGEREKFGEKVSEREKTNFMCILCLCVLYVKESDEVGDDHALNKMYFSSV